MFLSRICSSRGCNVPSCPAPPRPIPRAVLTHARRHARRGTALARLLRDGPLRAPGGTPRGSSRARRTWRASTPSSSTGPTSRLPRCRAGRDQRRRSAQAGVHPRLPLEDGSLQEPHNEAAFQFLEARSFARRRAADALARVMLRQAAQIDRHRRPLELRVAPAQRDHEKGAAARGRTTN